MNSQLRKSILVLNVYHENDWSRFMTGMISNIKLTIIIVMIRIHIVAVISLIGIGISSCDSQTKVNLPTPTKSECISNNHTLDKATYYDKVLESGTIHISGPRSGCTNSIIPANGLLNLPYFYEGCTCSYPLPVALALIKLPQIH